MCTRTCRGRFEPRRGFPGYFAGHCRALPDGYYGEFQVRAMMPDEPGTTLWFPTVQVCEEGSIEWVQLPDEGQNPYELDEPSPFLRLVGGS